MTSFSPTHRTTPMPYTLPALPYAYTALEPHLDAQTMEIHHSKHHQTYINNLNAALEGSDWAEVPVEALLLRLAEVPANLQGAVLNQGGGHAHHRQFGRVLSPPR